MESAGILALLFMVVLIAVFFLIFRQVMLWYWRVNEIATTLAAILEEQRKMVRTLRDEPEPIATLETSNA